MRDTTTAWKTEAADEAEAEFQPTLTKTRQRLRDLAIEALDSLAEAEAEVKLLGGTRGVAPKGARMLPGWRSAAEALLNAVAVGGGK